LEPVVSVRGLRFTYPDGTEALRGVDFDLFPGESVALLGANGSGKTTFLLHLVGLLTGTGQVQVAGMAVEKATLKEVRRRVGFVFQDADDQIIMPTALEDVAYGLRNSGVDRPRAEQMARGALDELGVGYCASRAPYHLSAGEKRRVALAGVLVLQPEVLVLDEPTTSLDPPAQRELIQVLRKLPQAKILSTHDATFARAVAGRAVFFEKGEIKSSGGVPEVAIRHRWVAESD
jgi:cobalt/nickel transport system ATP-binding protein